MPKINPIFDYVPLQRVTKQIGRYYDTPSGTVPSVTTVLAATGDKTALMNWRKRIGEDEAARQTTEAANLGTLVHKHLECFISNEPRPKGTNQIHVMARDMSDRVIQSHLALLTEVWGLEAPLFYPELYAGTADCVGLYNGTPAIIDFKTSKKNKKTEHVVDYFLQASAYCLAHNIQYGTNIRKFIILMTNREDGVQSWTIEGREFDKYSKMWVERLDTYWSTVSQ
jgi:genome maintenance exonuclease 1